MFVFAALLEFATVNTIAEPKSTVKPISFLAQCSSRVRNRCARKRTTVHEYVMYWLAMGVTGGRSQVEKWQLALGDESAR